MYIYIYILHFFPKKIVYFGKKNTPVSNKYLEPANQKSPFILPQDIAYLDAGVTNHKKCLCRILTLSDVISCI